MSTQEAIARAIAEKAHAGQVDRCGAPYIDHPAHVASRVQGDAAKAVAWLHDVVEDTDVTLDDLREAGLSEEVVAGVAAMTHHEDEPYLDYVRRAKADPLARQVKLQDLLHNLDLGRFDTPTLKDVARVRNKYLPALELLLEE